MTSPEHDSLQFSAENRGRRDFLKLLTSAGLLTATGSVSTAVSGLLSLQRLEAAESSRSINWKEILGQFGESVPIAGEVDPSGKDMIVGRTMNEIYKLYLQQQKDWCAKDAAYCEGETPHARRDNRVLVPSDYMLSVPIPRAGQSVTSRDADKIPSIYLPLNGYTTAQNIADFGKYANDILGLSGQYSDLQMVDESGDSRPLLLSKQGVPVFFSAEELLFIYAHYRMNKVTAEEIKFAGTVLDYGGVNSAAQARALRYKRIGNVRWDGMNNLQKSLDWMLLSHRFINEEDNKPSDSIAPFANYRTMTERWNQNIYRRGNTPTTTPEQTQARIRAMLAKDPEPLGESGRGSVGWWSSSDFPLPTVKNPQAEQFSAENPIDLANQLYPNDPLKAAMIIGNLQLKVYFDYYVRGFDGGNNYKQALQTTKTLQESESAQFFQAGIKAPRNFLIEKGSATTIAHN